MPNPSRKYSGELGFRGRVLLLAIGIMLGLIGQQVKIAYYRISGEQPPAEANTRTLNMPLPAATSASGS